MRRTVRLPLTVTAEQASALSETTRQFTAVFNAVCADGWEANQTNGVRLHHRTYRPLKERFPGLVSDLHIQARVKATEALKAACTRRRQGRKTSCPRSAGCAPRYNRHTFTLDWPARAVKLSTTAGRLVLPFALPEVFAWAEETKVCTADLVNHDGRFWLHVVVDLPAPAVQPRPETVGVDLGLAHPAVTSDNVFLGGKRWRGIEDRLFRRKRRLQRKGTKSAKRRLRILQGKQARFRRDCDHVLSKRIVESVPPGGTVVLEDLTDLRQRCRGSHRFNRRLHGWSFAQLRAFVAYKAEARGVRVAFVDPRHTSQTCSRCGHQHRSNRKSQARFCCRRCGFTLNADLNASRNVRAKYHGTFGRPVRARPPSTGPTGLKAQGGGDRSARKPSPSGDGR